MKGAEVISKLNNVLSGDELIVSSNGNVSRQAFHLLPQPQLYLRGSMGLPVSVGLGLALALPGKDIIILTGDGNFLMGLSSMTTVAYLKPSNLKIIILDNELYSTTGGQETVSSNIGYLELVLGMGVQNINSIDSIEKEDVMEKILSDTIKDPGLQVLHIKVEEDTIDLENIPWHPVEIKERFLSQLDV
ncbi:MAG: thiamine pyrophosphate-dependent enzyme [Candidatus Thorarchaeota archaeon]